MVLSFPARPARLRLTVAVVAIGVGAAGCSGDPEPAPTSSTSSTTTPSATTSTPPPPLVTGAGLPADLVQTMTALYGGGAVRTSGTGVAQAVAARKPISAPITVGGEVKSYKGVPISVVTTGKDVTLLVKNGSWFVVGGWWPSLRVSERVPQQTLRVLAIGSDARPNQTPGKFRADALQIIGVDRRGIGGIVGIPRDSYVPLSTGGSNKINAAMVFGGVSAEVATVKSTTGVPIDGYVMTGFKGFDAMVDAMGGLSYTSAAALTSHVGKPLLKKGANLLDGLTTLNFARERKNVSGGDFGRTANQGRIILSGMAMARAKGPGKLPTYVQTLGTYLETDLTPSEALTLASSIFLTEPSKVPTAVAQGSIGTRSGQSVVLLGSQARSVFTDIKDGRLG